MSNKELPEISDHRTKFRKSNHKKFRRRRDAEILSLTKHDSLSEKHKSSVQCKNEILQEEPEGMATNITQLIKGERLGREGMVFSNTASVNSASPTPGDNISESIAPKYNVIDRFTTQMLQRSKNLDKHMYIIYFFESLDPY